MTTGDISLETALAAVGAKPDVRSAELLRHGTLTVKMYAPRGHDPQTPHAQDEIYVIAKGHGQFFDGEKLIPVTTGDLLFAAAGRPHRFENFSADFATWVMFYGPDGGEAGQT